MPQPLAPLAVLSPPDGVPSQVPTKTRIQYLPFEALTWENFERLCHRLTKHDANVEYCARYGRQGDAQEGIDIFARQSDGRYHCLQAKRHRSYGPAKLRNAVDLFLAGSWADRAARFTIVVQAQLSSPEVQEEIERQAERLEARGCRFLALDGDGLTERLREHPVLIDDFFGRDWVAALLGHDIANSLGSRLDGAALARVRAQLTRVYEAHFQSVDPGSFGSIGEEDGRAALSLVERFLRPDMLVRETTRNPERIDLASESDSAVGSATLSPVAGPKPIRSSGAVGTSRMRRLPLAEWFGDGDRMVVLGDAGCGKSTFLRVIALDLLRGQTHFPELVAHWGLHTPIYIPFARWSSQVARGGSQIGIKEIVRRSLEQFLTSSIVDLLDRAIDDGRILLLIDGLDEWGNEQAARSTLSALVTTVEAHSIPVIVSGRPRGLDRIGTLPAHWKRGTIAPLSLAQQAAIAGRWFHRYSAAEPEGAGLSEGRLRTSRFMAELARDANLGALADVPLLLIGLVTLAMRGQMLPRTRGDVYDQLVRVLLEVHPDNRATASGDTESRFRHATDPGQRRAAIARLAFAVRDGAADGGIQVAEAREILRAYLASPQGFDLAESSAAAAAGEMLSVNAETQGMIVEKAPGEVGFVHASFEEFLCAEYVGGRPFREIEAFVRDRSSDGRWRNVIVHLLGRQQRRDEVDQLVAIIEEPEPDELLRFHNEAVLGDVAFGIASRSPATAKRLAFATMRRVETEDWLPARREALASVLKGLADPALKAEVERRLERWLPARLGNRESLISRLGAWSPTAALQDTLWLAMHDEDRGVQRAAAAAYAQAFAPMNEPCERLVNALARTRDVAAAAAMLESLALGWANVSQAGPLFEEAYRSHSAELRLVGILGLAEIGAAPEAARDAVLRSQNFWSDLSYPHRALAGAMLMKYWPGDDMLIKGALRRVSGHSGSPWENDVATAYLMESPANRPDVRAWILAEFARDYPFISLRGHRLWAQVGRFAKADPDIRAAANTFWCNPKNQLINLYAIPAYVAQVADAEVADALILALTEPKAPLGRYWAVSALLTGWGRDNPAVKPAIDALADLNDEDLGDLVALLPKIMPGGAAARERLIRMGAREDIRRDLLAAGLEACGCDHTDNDAIGAILAFPDQQSGNFDASYPLFRAFGANPKVRALALARIHEADGPLLAIAEGYTDDSAVASLVFEAATPLPVDLRTQIVEVAATGAAGTGLEAVLGKCMLETDHELRARMVIAYHRSLPPEAHPVAEAALVAKAVALGAEYESARATALAGLVTIRRLDALVSLKDRGKPVALATRGFVEGIETVERLVCERFGDFAATFGDSLAERFTALLQGGSRLPEILSAAPGASPEARAAFLALAERGEIPRTPRALRALAAERPHSDLLLTRCWEALDDQDHGNNRAMVNAEIGLILRDEFPGDVAVRQRLVDRFTAMPSASTAIMLAIFAPDAEVLPLVTDFNALGRDFGDWAAVVHVAARRADSTTFCVLLEAMVTRARHLQFDAQPIINLAVEERLQSDTELEGLLAGRIEGDSHPSVSGSFARYLAAAGKLGAEARRKTLDLLQALGRDQRLPTAGYDALADQWRALRATLLDAVSAGFELG